MTWVFNAQFQSIHQEEFGSLITRRSTRKFDRSWCCLQKRFNLGIHFFGHLRKLALNAAVRFESIHIGSKILKAGEVRWETLVGKPAHSPCDFKFFFNCFFASFGLTKGIPEASVGHFLSYGKQPGFDPSPALLIESVVCPCGHFLPSEWKNVNVCFLRFNLIGLFKVIYVDFSPCHSNFDESVFLVIIQIR